MPNGFFHKKNIFHYDPVSMETREKYSEPHKSDNAELAKMIGETASNLTTIRPSDDIRRILNDINRDFGNKFKINGQDALDLRKQDKLTPAQYTVAKLDVTAIDTMALSMIKKLAKPLISVKIPENGKSIIEKILDTTDLTAARIFLKDYHTAINSKDMLGLTSLEDAKSFLKKHLLSSVENGKEQDFLAEEAIRGLHQSGFTRIAEAYYTTQCTIAILATGTPLLIEDNAVKAIAPPKREGDALEYKNGRVHFTSTIHYQSMTDSNGKIHDPDTRITSTFSIKTSKPFFSKKFDVDFRVDKLDIRTGKDKTFAAIFEKRQPKQNLLQYIMDKLFKKKPAADSQKQPKKLTRK